MKHVPSFHYARVAAEAAEDKLGEDIVALDVRNQTAVSDCFLIIGAASHLHVRALEDAVRERLKEAGARLLRTDGQRGNVWRALDYGSLIIHIMDKHSRNFYAIERLWEQGRRLPLKRAVAKTVSPKRRGHPKAK